MTHKIPVTIFYSWQSDLSKDTNQKAIGSCIKKAIIPIEENNDTIHLLLDEATRNEAGSPDIPSTIFRKIESADIFICDVTTINQSEKKKKKTPNPNVLIELGYAISVLGWNRIIMVFNKKFGDFSTELPFDIDKRRITVFSIIDKADKSGQNDLTSKLNIAIDTIIKTNPSKNINSVKDSNGVKKAKDIVMLNKLMQSISIPTFDFFIHEMPDRILERIFFFWFSFHDIYDNNSFHVYDKILSEKLKEFRISWSKCLNYGHLFNTSKDGKYYVFNLPFDVFPDAKTEQDFKELTQESLNLEVIFKDLILFIRENYIEVDLDELSEKAWQNYLDYNKE